MSLGDLGNNLNKQAGNTYNEQRERIMREAKEQEARRAAQEADRMNREISQMRLQKQTLEGRIQQLTMEIAREKNVSTRTLKQNELHRLQNDKHHLEGEIISKQGRASASHNIRYDNPHYF